MTEGKTDAPGVEVGLCARCAHRRLVTSGKGSTFVLCERSHDNPAFPRYPALPVLACRGHAPREGA